ncbi:MAG: M28 family peptidase [Gemmatimonadota bacterium]
MRRLSAILLLAGCASSHVASTDVAGTGTAPGRGIVWPDEGPTTWPSRPTVPEITANDLRTRLYPFAHDSMEGRRIGEPGNYKGTATIAAEFARLGLKPAGESGTYFQDLPFGPIGIDVASAALSFGGTALAVRSDWIPIARAMGGGLGGSAQFADVATVFAGRWGDSATLDPAVFRGKVAVFLATSASPGADAAPRPAPELMRCDSLPDTFGAAAAAQVEADRRAGRLPAVVRPSFGPSASRDVRAQAAGAVGVLIVASAPLAAGVASQAFAERMVMQPAPGGPASEIGGAIVAPAVASRLFGRSPSALSVGANGQALSGRWSYSWRKSSTPARNVIAILPGSDPARAAEYVLVGAHNDHVGVNGTAVDHDSLRAVNTVTRRQGANDPACRPTTAQQHAIDSLIARARRIRTPRRDSIMNGADDDGSGTVVMLEIAEKFASEKPSRSIIFISHQGEEGGLLGSRWFVDHPTVPLASIVAAHNMDMVGKGRVEQVKFGGPASVQMLGARRLSREFGDIIDSVNAVRAEVMAIDKTWEVKANPLNRFCRSDQVNYVRKDIPVTYFSLGYAQDYHQPTDEAQYIDYEHAARLGRFIHDVMWAISERRDRPAIAGADPEFPNCR